MPWPWGIPHLRGGKGYSGQEYSGVCYRDGLRPSLGREGLARETQEYPNYVV